MRKKASNPRTLRTNISWLHPAAAFKSASLEPFCSLPLSPQKPDAKLDKAQQQNRALKKSNSSVHQIPDGCSVLGAQRCSVGLKASEHCQRAGGCTERKAQRLPVSRLPFPLVLTQVGRGGASLGCCHWAGVGINTSSHKGRALGMNSILMASFDLARRATHYGL